jgi:hypothetical protein
MHKITIGMPEFLLIYSLYMYDISWGLSIFALVIALIGRTVNTLVEYGNQKQNGLEKKLSQ